MPSEKDCILRERRACEHGMQVAIEGGNRDILGRWLGSSPYAKWKYPLPKKSQMRVIEDSWGLKYRFTGDKFQVGSRHGAGLEWEDLMGSLTDPVKLSAERLRIFADLKENPNEEVDDE